MDYHMKTSPMPDIGEVPLGNKAIEIWRNEDNDFCC